MALPRTTAPMPQRWPQPPLKPLASAVVAEASEAAAMVATAATAKMVLRNMGSLLFLVVGCILTSCLSVGRAIDQVHGCPKKIPSRGAGARPWQINDSPGLVAEPGAAVVLGQPGAGD